MRHARAKQIAFMVQKNLRLVDQATKRSGMHDAVTVALVGVA
jgi:Holliday junction resolvasome RuvABC endonuclease subunit